MNRGDWLRTELEKSLARVKELERIIYERCDLEDKCPDNPCCSEGCKMYEGCYPNTYRAQSRHLPTGVSK
jgi:hypothetical protein